MPVNIISEIKLSITVNPGSEITDKYRKLLFYNNKFFLTRIHCCRYFCIIPVIIVS